MTAPKLIHMDVDTGVDDALAIMTALNLPHLHLLAISTVAGNTSARQAAINTAFLLRHLGVDIPIHVGAEQTCTGCPVDPAHQVHGDDGLGGITKLYPATPQRLAAPLAGRFPPEARPPEGRFPPDSPISRSTPDSVHSILHSARQHQHNLHLILTGPVTNLALALALDRQAISQISDITIMSGSIHEPGNVTPTAEFNARSDPTALQIVLNSGLPITMVPLDVTHQVRLFTRDLEGDKPLDPDIRRLITQMTHTYRHFHHTTTGFDACYLHDPLTVLAVANPALYTFERMQVNVTTHDPHSGRTTATPSPSSKVQVAMAVNVPACLDLFWKAMQTARSRAPE